MRSARIPLDRRHLLTDPSSQASAPPSSPSETVLALQREIGNAAVQRLVAGQTYLGERRLQRVSKQAKTKLGKPPFKDELTVEQVEQWKKKGQLTDGDIDKLIRLDEKFIDAVSTMEPAWFRGAASSDDVDELYMTAQAKKRSGALAAESKRQTEALVNAPKESALHIALTGAGVSPENASAFLAREDHPTVKTWAASTPPAVVKRAVEAAVAKNVSLAQIQALLARNAELKSYDQATVVNWVAGHGVDRVRDALEGTQADANPAFVDGWLSTGANTASSSVVFKKLVRLQARLKKDGTAGLGVFQPDVPYVGSHDPPSRTGFLLYDFGDAEDVELHTHWNEAKKLVVSVHVKEGASKSTEINTWSFFGDVTGAVVAAHNAATGPLVPTTRPPGGKLTS